MNFDTFFNLFPVKIKSLFSLFRFWADLKRSSPIYFQWLICHGWIILEQLLDANIQKSFIHLFSIFNAYRCLIKFEKVPCEFLSSNSGLFTNPVHICNILTLDQTLASETFLLRRHQSNWSAAIVANKHSMEEVG